MLRYLLLVVAVLAMTGPARAEDNATAKRLYELQLEQAEKGNPQAQYYLGEMHEYGLGTPENHAAALDWYRRAASQKHLAAMRKVRELTAEKAKPKAPAPIAAPAAPPPAVEPTPAPAVVTQPAPAKPDPAVEAAKAAAAKAQAARAATAEKEAQRKVELDAKLAAAEKEKRRAKAKAALERMKADVKKNGVGY